MRAPRRISKDSACLLLAWISRPTSVFDLKSFVTHVLMGTQQMDPKATSLTTLEVSPCRDYQLLIDIRLLTQNQFMRIHHMLNASAHELLITVLLENAYSIMRLTFATSQPRTAVLEHFIKTVAHYRTPSKKLPRRRTRVNGAESAPANPRFNLGNFSSYLHPHTMICRTPAHGANVSSQRVYRVNCIFSRGAEAICIVPCSKPCCIRCTLDVSAEVNITQPGPCH